MKCRQVQVYGRKKVRLVAPKDSKWMYPYTDYCGLSRIEDDKWANYPDFCNKVTVYEAILGPGEGLVIPMLWWHQIIGLEPSISVNIAMRLTEAKMASDQEWPSSMYYKFYASFWYEMAKSFMGFPRPTRLYAGPSLGVFEGTYIRQALAKKLWSYVQFCRKIV